MFLKSTLLFSSLTFISRIFGFAREILFAYIFGTTMFADAFTIAFRLPNLFRSTFAEGAFSAAFVPIFSKKYSSEGKEKAMHFASNIFGILTLSLLALIFLFEAFMPQVIQVLARGFESDPYKFKLTIQLTRITTPYLFFVSLVAFYSCILNSLDKFFALAFSPIILNIVMIIGLYFFGKNQPEKVVIAAWTVFIGGVIQLVFIIKSIINKEVLPKIQKPDLKAPDISRFFRNLTPAFLSSSVTQLNLFIGTMIATSIPGAATIIYFADRLVQLPASLIGVSIGIVILPTLSRAVKAKQFEQANFLQNRAIEISLILSLPCLISLIVLAKPIILLLFQRGAFLSSDTARTIPALIALAAGVPAYVINKILVSNFFANEETKVPFKISVLCLIVNVTGSLILIRHLEHVGITISTAVTAWLNTVLLIIFGYRKNIFRFDVVIKIKLLKMCLSCVFLYMFLHSGLCMLSKYIYKANLIAFLTFAALILSAFLVYLFALYTTRTYSLNELKKLL